MKRVLDLSNANTIKNADGLIATKPIDQVLNGWRKLENECLKIDVHFITDFGVAAFRS